MLAPTSFTWIATWALRAFTVSDCHGSSSGSDNTYAYAYVCTICPLFISVKPYIMWAMPRKEKPFPLDLLFRALADRTRLRLLNLIADREICVCYFVEILRISQPKISRHLAYLRRAGIVAARRQGRWMHYRLVSPRDAVASAILRKLWRICGKSAGHAGRFGEARDQLVATRIVRAAARGAATADPIQLRPGSCRKCGRNLI